MRVDARGHGSSHCLALDLRKFLESYRVLNWDDDEACLKKEDHVICVVLKCYYSCNETDAILHSDTRWCEYGSPKTLTMTCDDLICKECVRCEFNTVHFMEKRKGSK